MKKSAKIKFLIAGLLLMFLNDGTTYFGIKTTYIGIVFLFISTLLFMKVIKTKDDSDENKDEFSTKILKISILMIGVVAFIGYRIFYVNNNQDLYLVNGFSDECKVDFADGTTVIIKANDHASIQLPEGTHKVTVSKPNAETYSTSFKIENKSMLDSFLGTGKVFIFNPYKGGILYWQSIVYRTISSSRGNRYIPYLNSEFFVLNDCDYIFKEMPETVVIEKNSETKTGIINLNWESPIELAEYLEEEKVPVNQITKFLQAQIQNSSFNFDVLTKYADLAYSNNNKQIAFAFITKIADNQPNNIELQRYYQSLLISEYGESQALNLYKKKMDREPNNANLNYLVGRVSSKQEDIMKHYENAIKLDPKHSYSYYGIGYNKMMSAKFTEAKSYFKKAVSYNPQSEMMAYGLYSAQLATKDYNGLIADNSHWNEEYWDGNAFYNLIELYNITNQPKEAVAQVSQYNKRCNKDAEKEYKNSFKLNALITNAYYSNNKKVMNSLISQLKDKSQRDYYKFNYCLWCNQSSTAAYALKSYDCEKSENAILLYISYIRKGNTIKAAESLKNCIEYYKNSTFLDNKKIVTLLQGKEPYVNLIETFTNLSFNDFTKKRELALALSIIYPHKRQQLISLAEKFNFSLDMPYQFITESIKDLKNRRI